jgi:transcriptional regulator with XRE-family HTH domain
MDDLTTIGDRVRYIRKLRGYTQEEMGDILHLTKGAVQAWELNKNTPRVPELIKLASMGGLTIDWICLGRERDENQISKEGLELARIFDEVSDQDKLIIFSLATACYRQEQKK